MGQPLLTQRRGKGSPSFTAPSHRFKTRVRYKNEKEKTQKAEIIDFVDDPGRTIILMKIK